MVAVMSKMLNGANTGVTAVRAVTGGIRRQSDVSGELNEGVVWWSKGGTSYE